MAGFAFPINASAGSPSYDSAGMRRALAALMTPGASGLAVTAGVRPGSGLDVTVAGTTITVTAGTAVVQGASSTTQGPYLAWLDASATLTLTAADGTNPRSDLVYLRVRDTDSDGTGARDCSPQYIAGTPGASPVTPTIPAGTSGIVLAVISVPQSGGGSPTVSYASRGLSVAAGAIQPVQSGLLAASGLYVGQYRHNLVTGFLEQWNGSAWMPYAQTLWARRTSDGAGLASSTTYTADGVLTVPLAAGATYLWDGFVAYTTLAAAGINMRWSYSGTAGSGSSYTPGAVSGSAGTTTDIAPVRSGAANYGTGQAILGGNGTSSQMTARPAGSITTSTAGNLFFEYAQNTSNATATVIRAGSWVRVQRVA